MAHDIADVAAVAAELPAMAADHQAARLANNEDPAEQLAWRRLTAQHPDRRIGLQRRALRLTAHAVSTGSAGPRDLAFLRDRTLVNERQRQIISLA